MEPPRSKHVSCLVKPAKGKTKTSFQINIDNSGQSGKVPCIGIPQID